MKPDDTILFDTLSEAGASPQVAHRAVQEIRNMAGQNIITELGAKIEALDAKIDANQAITEARFAELDTKIEAQRSRLDYLATKDDLQKTKVWWLATAGAATLSLFGTIVSHLAK